LQDDQLGRVSVGQLCRPAHGQIGRGRSVGCDKNTSERVTILGAGLHEVGRYNISSALESRQEASWLAVFWSCGLTISALAAGRSDLRARQSGPAAPSALVERVGDTAFIQLQAESFAQLDAQQQAWRSG
jgi:hypothetical protein